jgi:hypothetical protein
VDLPSIHICAAHEFLHGVRRAFEYVVPAIVKDGRQIPVSRRTMPAVRLALQ